MSGCFSFENLTRWLPCERNPALVLEPSCPMARVVIGYGPNQKTSARMSSGFVFRKGSVLLGKLRTDVETAVRAGRVDFEGAGRLLRYYQEGLHGYTYLEG